MCAAARVALWACLTLGLAPSCCIIIDPPLVFPDDFGKRRVHPSADDRMHKAVEAAAMSRHNRLLIKPGVHTWRDGEDFAWGMYPAGPARLSYDNERLKLLIRNVTKMQAEAAASKAPGGGDSEDSSSEPQYNGPDDDEDQVQPDAGDAEEGLEADSEQDGGESESEESKETARARQQREAEAEYWPKYWAKRHKEGFVNRDVQVPVGGKVRFLGVGGGDNRPVLQGSWKLLDESYGSYANISLENGLGSVVEIWSAEWDFSDCSLHCAGHFVCMPVAVYAHRLAVVRLRECTLGKLSTAGRGEIAHFGLLLTDKASATMANCKSGGFKISDVYSAKSTAANLAKCVFNMSTYGVQISETAKVTVEECEFRDCVKSALIANSECDEAELVLRNNTVLGRVWSTSLRPGNFHESGTVKAPPMCIPGREDSRWELNEEYFEDDEDSSEVGRALQLIVPESCSADDLLKDNIQRVTDAINQAFADGKKVTADNIHEYIGPNIDTRPLWLREEWNPRDEPDGEDESDLDDTLPFKLQESVNSLVG